MTELAPLAPTIPHAWYVGCLSSELGAKPVARVIHGVPIVLFRGASGKAAALVDRCPHRNVPLSFGEVTGDDLRCGYHGWTFGADGACTRIPGLTGEVDAAGRRAAAYPVVEQQGLVWLWTSTERAPVDVPVHFRGVGDDRYLTVIREVRASGSVHQVIENALDVPHTAFLHGGLFRNDGERREIECVVQRWHDRCECEYIGEARPEGLAARLLSPSGGLVTHFDRFILPSITEVEYRIGDENHVILNGACTPVDDWDTRLYAVVSIRSRMPDWVLKPLVLPLALRIFAQDAEVLQLQTDNIRRFGEEAFTNTELDLLGPHILRLMRQAARDELGDPAAEPYRRESTMRV